MTTKLEGALKREIAIEGVAYTVTIDPAGLKLVPKGKRKGYELAWAAFVSGEAALATALNASLAAAPSPPEPARAKLEDAGESEAVRTKRTTSKKNADKKEAARPLRAASQKALEAARPPRAASHKKKHG